MQHVLIIHEVELYSVWKTIFDLAADIEKARRRNQLSIAALRQRCKQDRPLLDMVFTDDAECGVL